MKATEVRKQIQSGETAPLYLLEGDDLQSRHELATEFATLVDEGLQAFNVQSFYANEATTSGARDQLIANLLCAARTLPMMAPRRVLIVHAAERLLSPRKSKEDDDDTPPAATDKKRRKSAAPTDELEQYLSSPEPLTTLVLVADALDANRRLVKLVRKHAVSVDCGALGTDAEAARWIGTRLAQDGLTIEPRATALLLETTGRSLGRIRAEVEKLVLYAAGETAITVRHIKDMMVPQAEPSEDFALGRAIWNGNARVALRELTALLDAGAIPVMVLGQIRAAVRGLRPDETIKRSLDAVFQTDLDMKSSAGEPRYLLERLVIDICSRR